jgi:hypothetical protein
MPIALIFTACLMTAPLDCQRVEVVWKGTMQECALLAQQALAAWQREHVEHAVRGRYRCDVGRAS